MKKNSFSISNKIFIITIIMIIISTIISSFFSLKRYEELMLPELELKTVSIAHNLESLISRSCELGIPFESQKGMKELLENTINDYPEISYISIFNKDGKLQYNKSVTKKDYIKNIENLIKTEKIRDNEFQLTDTFYNTSVIIKNRDKIEGRINIGINKRIIQEKYKSIFYDILTILFISLLFTFEFILFFITYLITQPVNAITEKFKNSINGNFSSFLHINLKDELSTLIKNYNSITEKLNITYEETKEKLKTIPENKRRLIDEKINNLEEKNRFGANNNPPENITGNMIFIRIPLFLLIFSEAMSLSFFPVFVNRYYTPIAGIPKDIIISLPISIFMLFWTFSLIPSGIFSDNKGRRISFMTGAILTGTGLILTGFVNNIFEIMFLRSITAIGFGMVFITSQSYITDNTDEKNRTLGMAIFQSGYFSGSLCGTAIGGIIADQLGYSNTFILSGILSIISAVFVYNFLKEGKIKKKKAKFKFKNIFYVLKNPSFIILIIFSAIPAKFALTAFYFFIVPLFLESLGNTPSTIGRIMISYGFTQIIISPVIGKIADKIGNRMLFVQLGGFISGAGMILLYFYPDTLGVFAAISLLGIAHSLSVSSQLAIIPDICRKECNKIGSGAVIGVFRLLEKIGSIFGPLIAGYMVIKYNYDLSSSLIGLFIFSGTCILSLFFFFKKKENHV